VSLNAPVLITPWLLCLNPLYGSPDSTQRKFVIEVTTEIRDEFGSESRKARDSKFDADLNGTAGPRVGSPRLIGNDLAALWPPQ
jgi:hypothetical protein